MFKSQKHVFWNALVLTIFVFAAGIFLGFMIENWRTSQLAELYQTSELQLIDLRVQNDIFSLSSFDCDKSIEKNIDFANKLYEESKILERYDSASRISDSVVLQHKKYDLLRALFWVNSIKIKQKCNESYHNVVYIYDYVEPRLDIKAKQSVFSNLLLELKEKEGNNIMLIHFAGDIESYSIDLLMDMYNVTEEDLPVILIDEKVKISEIESVEDIEQYLK